MIFETIKTFVNKSQNTEINKLDAEQLEISEDNYPSYSAVHWVFNKKSYSKENFSKEFNQILEEYAEYGAKESALALLEEPEILVTYEAWIESENQLYIIMNV